MFFAGKIVEEGALANVGLICDVFDGSFRKTFFRKKVECRPEKAPAKFRRASLSPIATFRLRFGGTGIVDGRLRNTRPLIRLSLAKVTFDHL